jgi:hypothetical protein
MLALDSPFIYEKDYWAECVKESDRITPIFNKDGYFYDRYDKKAWIEVNGEAWRYGDKDGFLFKLAINDGNNLLSNDIMKAIKLLMREGMASKKQIELHYNQRCRKAIRATYVDSWKWRQRILKDLKKTT